MKKITAAALSVLIAGTMLFADDVTKFSCKKIIELPETTKTANYEKSKTWMQDYCNDGDSQIDYTNSDTATITGKRIVEYNGKPTGKIDTVDQLKFEITIDNKDGKSRITIKLDEAHIKSRSGGFLGKIAVWRNLNDDETENIDMQHYFDTIISDFETAMKKASAKEDW